METSQKKRRKRVQRLKKLILGSIFMAIFIPVITCIFLLVKVHGLEEQLAAISNAYENLNMQVEQKEPEQVLSPAVVEAGIPTITEPGETGRKVYLTFDDGPSAVTEDILDILDEYGVKATFFVTGEEAKSHPERYKDIVDRGHTLGMHSYSHKYSEIYDSKESFVEDLQTLAEFLQETTGVLPEFYRFPGGSSNTVSGQNMSVFTEYLKEEGIVYFDWNISSKDASNPSLSADEIFHNCTDGLEEYENAVILMHDSPKKASTVEALPAIISYIQQMEDTSLLPITKDTIIVQHKSNN